MYNRPDINIDDRMELFSQFWRYQDEQGMISELAEQWQTSRTFIYGIAERVREALDWRPPGRKSLPKTEMAVERLEQKVREMEADADELRGLLQIERQDRQNRRFRLLLELALSPVSEDKIARCMNAALGNAPSVGWINAQINRASQAALALMQMPEVRTKLSEAAIDELFNHKEPILSLVDPHTLMLAMPQRAENRQGVTWNKLLQQYPELEMVVSDQGSGLCKGVKLNDSELAHQADLFHFLRNLQREVKRLESRCYRAIERVDDALRLTDEPRLLDSARIQAWHEYRAKAAALDEKLTEFDWLETIIAYLEENLTAFDWRRQSLRSYTQAQAAICESLDLMEKLVHLDVTPIVSMIEGIRGTIVTFLKVLERKLSQVKIDWHIIRGSHSAVCSAIARVWYWQKCGDNTKQSLTALVALRYWQQRIENFPQVCQQVFDALDRVVRASSAVECLNSILRPYISVKKHLSQGFLALIALYWNMRPLSSRGGKSPFQLSGIDLGTDDWVEMIEVQLRRMAAAKQAA